MHTVEEVRRGLDGAVWQRMPYRQGVGGEVLARDFAALRVYPATRDRLADEAWLLLERPLDPNSDDLKQYVISGPTTITLADLTRISHVRARIERKRYENAKNRGTGRLPGLVLAGLPPPHAHGMAGLTWIARRSPPPPQRSRAKWAR